MQDKYLLLEKIDRVKIAQVDADFSLILTTLNKWSKKNSDNKELKELVEASVSAYGIVQSFQTDRRMYHEAISQYRQDKIEAVTRARICEQKMEESEGNLDKLIQKQ